MSYQVKISLACVKLGCVSSTNGYEPLFTTTECAMYKHTGFSPAYAQSTLFSFVLARAFYPIIVRYFYGIPPYAKIFPMISLHFCFVTLTNLPRSLNMEYGFVSLLRLLNHMTLCCPITKQ